MVVLPACTPSPQEHVTPNVGCACSPKSITYHPCAAHALALQMVYDALVGLGRPWAELSEADHRALERQLVQVGVWHS